ncbi:hypothetical protein HDU97_000947 [Phlyctochytrium planicorne]|nr:hypothetical protein HDU97_000947 [Phlyctochytrium planicorne]
MQIINLISFAAVAIISVSSTPVDVENNNVEAPVFSDPSPIPTRSLCPAPEYCPASFAPTPVCGSDGQTYSSNCHLQQAICADTLSVLRYQYTGSCRQEDFAACPEYCPALFAPDPVCGSDGQTYTSDCHLRQASCKDKSITLAARGECQQAVTNPDQIPSNQGGNDPLSCPAPEVCPFYFVDASICTVSPDGKEYKTFASVCALQQARCNKKSKFTFAYDGQCNDPKACDKIACTKDLKPVCGSNRRTYSNKCSLTVASCKDPKIKFFKNGKC